MEPKGTDFPFTGHFRWQWIERNNTQGRFIQVYNLVGMYITFTISWKNLKIMILDKVDGEDTLLLEIWGRGEPGGSVR